MEPAATKTIENRTGRDGERRPYIAGTRIGVEIVYVCHDLRGMTPDEIVADYPHLSLAQVHAALAYYYEHADQVREQMQRDLDRAELLEAE